VLDGQLSLITEHQRFFVHTGVFGGFRASSRNIRSQRELFFQVGQCGVAPERGYCAQHRRMRRRLESITDIV
jgi:hypothetical protein